MESHVTSCVVQLGDLKAKCTEYLQHKLLVIPEFITPDFVSRHFLPEVEKSLHCVHRVNVPKFKTSGSVSSHHLKMHAPNIYALYQSHNMKQFVETVVGEPLFLSPEHDPHAVALYHYTQPGDHIGVHYDKSFYRGRRYTVLLGLIQQSVGSKLVCYLGANKLNRRKNPMNVYTHPGTLVLFEGNALWHEVTPLSNNERRVILTMEYVTDQRMSPINRLVSHIKDRLLYFGKKSARK